MEDGISKCVTDCGNSVMTCGRTDGQCECKDACNKSEVLSIDNNKLCILFLWGLLFLLGFMRLQKFSI